MKILNYITNNNCHIEQLNVEKETIHEATIEPIEPIKAVNVNQRGDLPTQEGLDKADLQLSDKKIIYSSEQAKSNSIVYGLTDYLFGWINNLPAILQKEYYAFFKDTIDLIRTINQLHRIVLEKTINHAISFNEPPLHSHEDDLQAFEDYSLASASVQISLESIDMNMIDAEYPLLGELLAFH
jgi:hypothetical protein